MAAVWVWPSRFPGSIAARQDAGLPVGVRCQFHSSRHLNGVLASFPAFLSSKISVKERMSNLSSAPVIRAFTDDQVSRLTHVSRTQLRYWDATGFFHPSLSSSNKEAGRKSAYARIYSFRDIVSLKVLNALRNESKVTLQHLREVAVKLAELSEDKWLSTQLYVLKKRVVFKDGDIERYREVAGDQYVMGIALKIVSEGVEQDIERLSDRSAQAGVIERRRNVNHNAVVVAGTRIPVAAIQRFAEDGFSKEDILREYPSLSELDVRAALSYSIKKSAA
jgi:uncharacterized protein (DUF433 family)